VIVKLGIYRVLWPLLGRVPSRAAFVEMSGPLLKGTVSMPSGATFMPPTSHTRFDFVLSRCVGALRQPLDNVAEPILRAAEIHVEGEFRFASRLGDRQGVACAAGLGKCGRINIEWCCGHTSLCHVTALCP